MNWRNLFSRVFLLLLLSGQPLHGAQQPEYIQSEQPVSESPEDLKCCISYELDKQPPEPEIPELFSPFWSNTVIDARFRSYYFERDRQDSSNFQTWAYGGALSYQSGWWRNLLKLKSTLFTTQRIYGPEDKDGAGLLRTGQKGFFSLGEANLSIRINPETDISIYRQLLHMPYLNRNDSRMIPNTFEAYLIRDSLEPLQWIAGYARKMKKRDSDRFEYMSEAAGVPGTSNGQFFSGVRYSLDENSNIGFVDYYTQDVINTLYAEANHLLYPVQNFPLQTSLQYTNQQSTGTKLAGSFDTYSFGAKLSTTYRGFGFTTAATLTGNNNRIQKPFGGTPGFTSVMISDFDRAGENAWLVGISYDFKYLGLEGVSVYTNYVSGNTPDSGNHASADQSEWDITIDYKPSHPLLEGLWLRLRRGDLNREGSGNDRTDYRVILNYQLPLLH